MTDSSKSHPGTLAATLAAAFPNYIEDKLGCLGVEMDSQIYEVIAAATAELETALYVLLESAPSDQRQSPLELVRRATIPITAHLSASSVLAPSRDEQDVAIHPEDKYDLYPATSADLGQQAWQAHIQWGIDKARSIAGLVPAAAETAATMPSVALYGLAIDRRAVVVASLRERGYGALLWRNPAALAEGIGKRPKLVLVDLRHPDARDAVRRLVAAKVRVVAAGEGVDDFASAAVMALGAEEVVELDGLVERFDDLLPRLV